MTIAIVTDSTAYLPPAVVAQRGILVVPLHVVLGGQEHSEGVDVTAADVATALRSFVPVSTSRPAPQAFLEAYAEAIASGAREIVSVHISADMSSTVGGAVLAARDLEVPVHVVDSRALGMAMGYAVLAGADLVAARAEGVAEGGAAEGGAVDGATVAAYIERITRAATVIFYVDTLEYLRRGGRIGKAGALVGSALSIKPILGLREGHIVPLEKVRTSSRAIARLEDLAAEAVESAAARGEVPRVAVHHLDSAERAAMLAERLAARLGDTVDRVEVVELGAVVGAHVGPGTLAVAVVPLPATSPTAGR
ncbi:MAG: DegV family protein [Tetrasphaera sp.]|nr:DegV family protein [Tetrasphaera sp.]